MNETDIVGIVALTLVIVIAICVLLPAPKSTQERAVILIFCFAAVVCTGSVCYEALAQGVVTAVSKAGTAILDKGQDRFWGFLISTYFLGVVFLSVGIAALKPRRV